MTNLIGREREQSVLRDILFSKEAEFVAIYGRRRVGKTFLIREFFQKKGFFLEVTGTYKGKMRDQLRNFTDGLAETFAANFPIAPPKDWRDAFELLTKTFQKIPKTKKIILFLDEIPWLASKRSKLIHHLDYFWNRHWSKMPNVKLIVCGSAASWVLDNIINAKGGLHNRVTQSILLKPLDLTDTAKFLAARNIKYNKKQVLDIFMVMGGIPYYLKQIKRSKSVVQNINDMCFIDDGVLYQEFDRLFQSLFSHSEVHVSIIKALANAPMGLTLSEIANETKSKKGGRLTKRLKELEKAGFIKRFIPLGGRMKNCCYRIIDEYTHFYCKWIKPYVERSETPGDKCHWQITSQTSSWYSWAGRAYERACFKHAKIIATNLGIESTNYHVCDWSYNHAKGSTERGAQIDMIFDRDDDVIMLCEIKYSKNKIVIDKSMAKNLANKVMVFNQKYATEKHVTVALISTGGHKDSIWSENLVDHFITLEDLFE